MRVAVTGGAGYIGGWLMAELTRRGHEVYAQDIRHPGAGDRHWEQFLAFNLHDEDSTRDWLRYAKPEVVIHLAALYGRIWGEVNMSATAAANAGLAAEVARASALFRARLMYMSSSEVYGASADRGPVGVTSPLEPYNMYGLTKKWGEEACRLYAPDGLMITRLNMPFGPAYYPPEPGSVPWTSGRPGLLGYNVLHSMVWQAEHGYDLRVHRGTERCLTWIGDAVRGLADILESGQPGTWNVCRNDEHVPLEELAGLVRELTVSSSRIVVEDPPPGVTRRKSLTNAELLALGWVPQTTLDDGIRRTWRYYRRFDKQGVWQG